MTSTKSQKIAFAGLFLALGIILPYATAHGIGIPGTVLLPMHIPVLLCGFICGPFYGAALGLILPLLNSVLTGMPALFPLAPIMSAELFTYGLVIGALYHRTRLGKIRLGVYPVLIIGMLCGRIMYALMFLLLFAISGSLKAPTIWTAIVTGLPGIIIQLFLIPAVVEAVKRFPFMARKKAVQSAVNLISEERAVCLVIKENVIVKTETGRGVTPIIRLYESGVLENSFVVDKVVGKAAAMVMTLGKIKGCHAVTISKPALEWFRKCNVMVEYEKVVDYIINRTGDGMCPMEQTVRALDDNKDIIEILKAKIEELKK